MSELTDQLEAEYERRKTITEQQVLDPDFNLGVHMRDLLTLKLAIYVLKAEANDGL